MLKSDRPMLAFLYMCGAQFLFSSNILLLRVAERQEIARGDPSFHLSPWEPMLYRSLLLAAWCAFGLWRKPGEILEGREKFWLWARGTAGVLSLSAYYYAVLHIPLGMASLFSNSSPLYVTVLALLIGGERLSRSGFVALMGGFFGVGLVVLGARSQGAGIELFPLLIAAASGPLAATAYFSIRQLKRVRNEQIMMSLGLGGIFISTIVLLWKGFHFPSSTIAHLWLIASVIPAVLAQECLTRAFRSAPATQVTPLQYTGPVFATVFAWMILDENIPHASLIGIGIVLVFGLILPYYLARRAAALALLSQKDA